MEQLVKRIGKTVRTLARSRASVGTAVAAIALGGSLISIESSAAVVGPQLVFSSFLGGSDEDEAQAIVLDSAGNIYITGDTRSLNFPVSAGAEQPSLAGDLDAFVAKVNPNYTLAWATYLGGAGEEKSRSIAVDSAGNVYTTGSTFSADFPTTPGAYDEQIGGTQDAYVTKFSPAGQLLFSTYLGGSGAEGRPNVEVDPAGTVHVTGFTTSKRDFPLVNPVQPVQGGDHDAFAARMTSDGSTLNFSTYLGGKQHETPRCVATDAQGNTYVHGWTMSSNFPTTPGAYQTAHAGGLTDVFVTKIDNQSPPGLAYSTYIGGAGEDWTYNGDCMAVDSSGGAYVTGYTLSLDWPTVNAFQVTFGGGEQDAYVAKLSPDGTGLVYSTYLGGDDKEEGIAIDVDPAGYAYATGWTKSLSGFPIVNASTTKPGGRDAYLTKFEPAGNLAEYSTYVGGSNSDQGVGVDVDVDGNAYLVGSTGSKNFPTVKAFQAVKPGKQDAFVMKIAP
jgi:hypothetical protein